MGVLHQLHHKCMYIISWIKVIFKSMCKQIFVSLVLLICIVDAGMNEEEPSGIRTPCMQKRPRLESSSTTVHHECNPWAKFYSFPPHQRITPRNPTLATFIIQQHHLHHSNPTTSATISYAITTSKYPSPSSIISASSKKCNQCGSTIEHNNTCSTPQPKPTTKNEKPIAFKYSKQPT